MKLMRGAKGSASTKKGVPDMVRQWTAFIAIGLALAALLHGCKEPPTPADPIPDFVASVTDGTVPLQVQFYDRSQPGGYTIRAWSWDFGDGTGSTMVNPVKVYTTPGVYTVSLTITTARGNLTRRAESLIRMTDPTSFNSVGTEGGTVSALGVSLTVPPGAVKNELVVGISQAASPIPLPNGELASYASSTYTISHNNEVPELFQDILNGAPRPAVLRIPLIEGSVPTGAGDLGQVVVLARLADQRILPIPARVAEGMAVAEVLRMPARADFCVVYRPESRTLVSRDYIDESDNKEYVGGRWATWWKVNSSLALLQQLTALRLGSVSNPASFDLRNFSESELTATALEIMATAQTLSDSLAAVGIRRPLLTVSEDCYSMLAYNMRGVYPPGYESFSGTVYYDNFFGHIVIDPAALLSIAQGNAARYADDPSQSDFLRFIRSPNAIAEALFEGVYSGHNYPNIVTTGSQALGLPVPADRTADGQVKPIHFLEGFRRASAAWIGEDTEEISRARSYEDGQFLRLSQPIFMPYSASIRDYAQAGQELLFYFQNDPDRFPDPYVVIGGMLIGLREAFDEVESEGRELLYPEALGVAYTVLNEVLDHKFGEYYQQFAFDRAYENTEAAAVRDSDEVRAPYTLNEDRFDPDALIKVPFQSATDSVDVSGVTYPLLNNIPPMSTRALVFQLSPLTSSLTLTFNTASWNVDDDGNSMAVKVYIAGLPGVSLFNPDLEDPNYVVTDTDNDGKNDTVQVLLNTAKDDSEDCGREVIVLAANVNLLETNSLSVTAVAETPLNIPEEEVLDEYVHSCDPSFSYRLRNSLFLSSLGVNARIFEMTSGTWRGASEVYQPVWRHYLTVVEPVDASRIANTAMLVISGGSTGTMPSSADSVIAYAARLTNSVVALLQAVPNQPLQFKDETRTRSEDAIIAYSYDKYLTAYENDAPDKTWPVLLPMTRAAVRAMDVIQEYTSTRPISPVNIDGFVVVGASKRGWTTWLTAAADSRVVAAVPIVIDVLNMEQQMVHHRRAYSGYAPADYTQYKIFGGYSTAIRDYVEMNVFQRFGTPESASLLKIVDPITYASRLTMPKLIANSTGDQFFLPDSSRFYWNQLPGENYLYYAPNTDHGLTGSGTDVDSDTLDSIFAFYYAQLLNRNRSTADDVRLPGYTWQITPVPSENKVRITMRTEVQPIRVQLWQAFNPEYRDFRLQVLGAAWTRTRLYSPCEQNCLDLDLDPCDCSEEPEHVYEAEVDVPGIGQGWRAFLVRMIFPGFTLRDPTATNPADQVKTVNFTVSTPVQVVPDIYPDEL